MGLGRGYTSAVVTAAAVKAIDGAFAHVRVFRTFNGRGMFMLGSDAPLEDLTAARLASRLPPAAAADLVEWGPQKTAAETFEMILGSEAAVSELTGPAPETRPLTDDRPVNEYFLLRWLGVIR